MESHSAFVSNRTLNATLRVSSYPVSRRPSPHMFPGSPVVGLHRAVRLCPCPCLCPCRHLPIRRSCRTPGSWTLILSPSTPLGFSTTSSPSWRPSLISAIFSLLMPTVTCRSLRPVGRHHNDLALAPISLPPMIDWIGTVKTCSRASAIGDRDLSAHARLEVQTFDVLGVDGDFGDVDLHVGGHKVRFEPPAIATDSTLPCSRLWPPNESTRIVAFWPALTREPALHEPWC